MQPPRPRTKSASQGERVFSPAPFFSGYDRSSSVGSAAVPAGQGPQAPGQDQLSLGVRIVMLLAEHGRPMTTSEVAATVQAGDPALSEAIAKLVSAGLVHRLDVRGAALLELVPAA